MSEIAETLGRNIRELRKQSGWTQEYLAEKAKISVPLMTQIELARKSASLEVIEKIAFALNVSFERLFKTELSENKDINFKLHMLEKDIIDTFSNMIHNKFENAGF